MEIRPAVDIDVMVSCAECGTAINTIVVVVSPCKQCLNKGVE